MAWFCDILLRRTRNLPKMKQDIEFNEDPKDDAVRTRLADDIEEGSLTMEDEEPFGTDGSEKGDHKTKNTCFFRIKRIFRTIYKAVSSVVGLLVLLVAYSFLGAAIFHAIEGSNETSQKENVTLTREAVMKTFKELSNNLTQGYINQTEYNASLRQVLYYYEEAVQIASSKGVSNSTSETKWNFWGSMFFCGTIYTTIGYGHIAPSTGPGRVMAMIYAAVGIPLALICLAELGRHFTLGLKIVWAFCRRYGPCCRKMRKSRKKDTYDVTSAEDGDNCETKSKDSEASGVIKPGDRVYFGYKIDDEFNIPIYVAIGILLVYIFLGAMMYTQWEEWSYLESFYFVFISVSTIGFGDVLPAHPKFFLLSSVYVFIGLSLVSMCVNVAIEFFSETLDKARVNIDKAKVKAKEKAKEAKEKMHEVSKSLDRAKDRAKEKAHDIVKKKSLRKSHDRDSTPSDDIKSETSTPQNSPVTENPETNLNSLEKNNVCT